MSEQKEASTSFEPKQKSQAESLEHEKPKDSSDHPLTFECLTKCTKWFLEANVAGSQIKIPASSLVVKFSENAGDKSILSDDILDLLIQAEQNLSVAEAEVVQLNRPPHVTNPNSSNQSNGGYRHKEKVLQAQKEYDKQLALTHLADSESEA
jgi:hypothetical protein